eukprot:6201707-Pleurochrysis_carterae.AAC.1
MVPKHYNVAIRNAMQVWRTTNSAIVDENCSTHTRCCADLVALSFFSVQLAGRGCTCMTLISQEI